MMTERMARPERDGHDSDALNPPGPGEVSIPKDRELKFIFRELLRDGVSDDIYFDRIYPEWARKLSRIHWTPIPVVRRAVELLTEGRELDPVRILDVGSGAGKFCLIGAAISYAQFC